MIRQAKETRFRTIAVKLVIASITAILLLQIQAARAATAPELFADGNRLFHDDLYWAALLRYSQAAEAGMDTPLLHYNTGVAHYKARQYQRAEESLLKASRYGPLQALSHYNLGINAWRRGDTGSAVRWLQSARDQNDRRDIARLARRALREIGAPNPLAEMTAAEATRREEERPITNLELRIRVGAGSDDNVYRTPSTSYVDRSDPALPTVNPVVQSGVFVPVSLNARYQVNSFDHEGFFASYVYGGRFYQDKALNQADEFVQELAFGSEFRRREEDRVRRVYSAFKVAQHQEVYFDPDTGIERQVNGEDISDRMSYLRYGPEFWIQEGFGPLTIGARAKGQLWNYENVPEVSEYDHEFWSMGLNAQWRYSEYSLVRVTAEYYTRRFGDRPSYELNGTQPAGNTPVRYDYVEYGVTARQRITTAMWFGLSFRTTDRTDKHVGYYDYKRNDYVLDYHLNIGQRFDLEASGRYRVYTYDNAFAFNNPAAGRKTLETFTVSAKATYRLMDSLELAGEYSLQDNTSNDTRIEYSRGQFLLSLRWFY